MFEKIPKKPANTTVTRDVSPSPPLLLGGPLVPVSCVGEDLATEPALPSEGHHPASQQYPSSTPHLAEIKNPSLMVGSSKSWSNIVSNKAGKAEVSLSYFPPSSTDGSILIKPPMDFLERGNQSWSSSLVGYFLHSKLPFKVVEPIAKRLWGNRGLIKVLLHSKGYYIFKFNSDADRDNILASGPWHFASKVIVLKPWKEGVEFAKDDCDTFPIWVKLSNIPLSYWSADGISYIASGIGKPICADEITSHFELLNFARVCIEVKASFSFPSSLNVTVLNGETLEDSIVPIEVEYQSRPPSCPTCNVFGHSPLKCPKANYQWIPKAKNVEQTPLPPNSSSPGPIANATAASDWVTVSRGAKAGTDPLGPPLPLI